MGEGPLALMPWVLFTENFNFRPPEKPRCHVAYKAGTIAFVRRICAERAIEKGKAVPCERPVDER